MATASVPLCSVGVLYIVAIDIDATQPAPLP
jgi:hypothetical protein